MLKQLYLLLQILYHDVLLCCLLLRCLKEAVLLIQDLSESLNLLSGISNFLL